MWTPNSPPLSIWRAPLVPVALAYTAGVLADRFFRISFWFSVAALVASSLAWLATSKRRQLGLALLYLWGAAAAFGAAYHHWFREDMLPNDVSRLTSEEPRPIWIRGVLRDEPYAVPQMENDPLRTQMPREASRAVLRLTEVYQDASWHPVSGLATLSATGSMGDYHVGDEIELVGRLFTPPKPRNPGERDYGAFLRDQRIRAMLVVQDAAQSIRRIAKRWPNSVRRWLALVRAWANDVLKQHLPPQQQRVASALLLGDTNEMSGAEWEQYLQTGVIHVLAISGQHLVVLAGFLWLTFRLLHIRRRSGAIAVAVFLLGYALLTGGRPPVMRSACFVLAFCGGMLLRRPMMPGNVFALAWLVVLLINPTDVTNGGCLLSFLSVAVLSWGLYTISAESLFAHPRTTHLDNSQNSDDVVRKLIDESRPYWVRTVRRAFKRIGILYLISASVSLSVMPLVAHRFHVVSPVALIIGPIMMLLSAVALLSGFMVLLLGAFAGPLAWPFAQITNLSLLGCNVTVTAASDWPWAFWYVSSPPDWWLIVFYAGFLIWLTHPAVRHWRWTCIASVGVWIVALPIATWTSTGAREFRCTFLAVGHGGCTVIETPDGRTLLYDAGAITGPDVTRRRIAPFLWHRGIRRIDELFLSHADLDHFNGAAALLARFPVGRITVTPTFAERDSPGVLLTMAEIRRRKIPLQIVQAGDTLAAGDVKLDVIHPPNGFGGAKENERSMVVLVRYRGRTILLTGDLEGEGMQRVLQMPSVPVDVLMAPHHGSASASPTAMARWAKPKLVVSSQAKTFWENNTEATYREARAEFIATWRHGAVTVSIPGRRLFVETYLTKKNWALD